MSELDDLFEESATFCPFCCAWLSEQVFDGHQCFPVTFNGEKRYLADPTLVNIASRFGINEELEWEDKENLVVRLKLPWLSEICDHLDTIPENFWGKPFKAGKRFTKLNKTSPTFLGALLDFFRKLCSMRFFVKFIDLRKVYLCASQFLVDPTGILLTPTRGNWKPYIPLFQGFDKRCVEILELGIDDQFYPLEGQIPPADPCFAICRRLFDKWRSQNDKYIAALSRKNFVGFEITTRLIIENFVHTCANFDGNLDLACANFVERPEVIAFRESRGNPEEYMRILRKSEK